MGCNESENVNFSEKSYEANMSMYMCYEMRSVFKSNSPVHAHPMVAGFSLLPKSPLH